MSLFSVYVLFYYLSMLSLQLYWIPKSMMPGRQPKVEIAISQSSTHCACVCSCVHVCGCIRWSTVHTYIHIHTHDIVHTCTIIIIHV